MLIPTSYRHWFKLLWYCWNSDSPQAPSARTPKNLFLLIILWLEHGNGICLVYVWCFMQKTNRNYSRTVVFSTLIPKVQLHALWSTFTSRTVDSWHHQAKKQIRTTPRKLNTRTQTATTRRRFTTALNPSLTGACLYGQVRGGLWIETGSQLM